MAEQCGSQRGPSSLVAARPVAAEMGWWGDGKPPRRDDRRNSVQDDRPEPMREQNQEGAKAAEEEEEVVVVEDQEEKMAQRADREVGGSASSWTVERHEFPGSAGRHRSPAQSDHRRLLVVLPSSSRPEAAPPCRPRAGSLV